MQRLRHRPDYFVHRGNRMAYHRHQDGATFSRLDPYAAGEQSWLLNSGRVIFVTAAEVRDIAKQVNDQDLPDIRPTGDWDEARIQAIEERLAALEASSNLVERESVAPGPIPDESPLIKDLRARIAELESRPPEIRTVEVEKIVERVVEVPVAAVVEEAAGDGIPEEFRGLMLPSEPPEKFTERMKRRWQALQHLRIDGSKPTNSRALPDMTEEEIAELADLEARNKTAKWLD